jgi:hypothetical protein
MVSAQQPLSRGQMVSVDAIDGPVLRRVWEDFGWAVQVCSERQYEALERGLPAPMPIGFRRSDVHPATLQETEAKVAQ